MKLKMLKLQKLPINFWRTNLKLMTVLLFTCFAFSCNKGNDPNNPNLLPTLTSKIPVYRNNDSIRSGGNITNSGIDSLTARGVCWSTTQNPTIADEKTIDGAGTGSFTSFFLCTYVNTKYYVRAYATNSAGTAYGNEQSFKFLNESIPNGTITLSTTLISNITSTTATSGGNSILNSGSVITAKGVCWSTHPNPTIADSKTTDGTGNAIYTSSIEDLFSSTTYYVRAYAIYSNGLFYGDQKSFTTKLF